MELAPQRFRWHMQASGTLHQKGPGNRKIADVLIRNRFAEKIIRAVKGEKGVVEPTYIYLPGVSGGDAIAKETGVDYFSVPVELGVYFFGSHEIIVPMANALSIAIRRRESSKSTASYQ